MVRFKLPASQRRELRRKMEAWTDDLKKKVWEVVQEYAGLIWETAVELCPIDTGNLRSTLEEILMPAAMKALVGTRKTGYSIHVEFGTVKSPAQPFLRPAFEKYKDEFVSALERAAERAKA